MSRVLLTTILCTKIDILSSILDQVDLFGKIVERGISLAVLDVSLCHVQSSAVILCTVANALANSL